MALVPVRMYAGTKRWRLYEPVGGFHLPNKSSNDLTQDQVGKLVMDVTLKVGMAGMLVPRKA